MYELKTSYFRKCFNDFIHELRCKKKVTRSLPSLVRFFDAQQLVIKDRSSTLHTLISISPAPLGKGKGKIETFRRRKLCEGFIKLVLQFGPTITYRHAWLFIAVVRQFCSDSLKICHLASTTFVHAQPVDRCVIRKALVQQLVGMSGLSACFGLWVSVLQLQIPHFENGTTSNTLPVRMSFV